MVVEFIIVVIIILSIKLLPYAALVLFIIRLMMFITCENEYEGYELKKKVIHSAIFIVIAVIVRTLLEDFGCIDIKIT